MSNHPANFEGDWKIKRNRNGQEHAKKCKKGKKSYTVEGYCQIHHLLCVHACSNVNMPADKEEYIRACLAVTDWNINESHNTIGLPTKNAYTERTTDTGWDGLPCHQCDHRKYLKAIEVWVTDNIWNKLEAAKKKKACDKVKGKSVANLFKKGSKEWRSFLTKRGEGGDSDGHGTKACLDYSLSKSEDARMNDIWYIPFSMAPVVADIHPRRRLKKIPKSAANLLTIIR